jgi:predicted Zn-dependent protease
LLALAALREKQEDIARKQLSDLVAEYPDNHVFAEELARLTGRGGPAEKSGGSGEISD